MTAKRITVKSVSAERDVLQAKLTNLADGIEKLQRHIPELVDHKDDRKPYAMMMTAPPGTYHRTTYVSMIDLRALLASNR